MYCVFIILAVAILAVTIGVSVFLIINKITNSPPFAAFGLFVVVAVAIAMPSTENLINNIQHYNTKNANQKPDTAINKFQNESIQKIYINGTQVTAQEESDSSYNVFINGTTINPQNINLNDCDFSIDTESRRITIAEKGKNAEMKDMEPYEIHINGSDINIENLNLNDFAITVDEGNRWIVLTKK